MVLQFTFGISLVELNMVSCIVSSIVDMTLLLFIAEKWFLFRKLQYEEYPCLSVPILVISGGVDNTIMYLNRVYHPFLGVWTAIGCILFSCVTLMILTHINSRVVEEKVKIEKVCYDLENTMLVRQLEAHFIFNVLNMISSYCKTDPEEADRAIRAFSVYLRSYLHLITRRDNILIQKELELVEQYLTIQKMRVGNRLIFSFDTEILDFTVPSFTVQTIVENAVIHGIMGREEGGAITISTRREGDVIQLIIADTGVGFDTEVFVKESSVGLDNIKRRLEIMKKGTIKIDSTIGVGTTVIITLPIE